MGNDAGNVIADEYLQRKPIRESIFDALHQRIIAGKYSPGEWLRQEEIASQLGVSQTPVREALDLLVSAGLAERVPYRGVRVRQLSNIEIAEAYGLRLVLESVAARAAAGKPSTQHARTLSEIAAQTKNLTSLSDMSALQRLNREFHAGIVAASGNTLLGKMHRIMSNAFPDWMLYEYMFRHPELLQHSLATEYLEHTDIAQAIDAGEADTAVRLTIQHIRRLGDELIEYLHIPAELLREQERRLLVDNLPPAPPYP